MKTVIRKNGFDHNIACLLRNSVKIWENHIKFNLLFIKPVKCMIKIRVIFTRDVWYRIINYNCICRKCDTKCQLEPVMKLVVRLSHKIFIFLNMAMLLEMRSIQFTYHWNAEVLFVVVMWNGNNILPSFASLCFFHHSNIHAWNHCL